MLGIIFVARTAMGFQFQSIASTAPALVDGIGIGYAEVGTLIGLYMLPGVVLAIPSGILGQRFSDQRICTVALAVMAIGGVICGIARSYEILLFGRVFAGSGAVLFSLVLTKMVADWFAGREIVTAMAVMLASWPFGIAIALPAQPSIASSFGWPAVMHGTALLCGVALVLMATLYKDAPSVSAVSVDGLRSKPRALRHPSRRELGGVLSAGLMWGFFNVGLVIFFSFSPPLLALGGMSLLAASSVASLALWVLIVSVPLGGYLTERSGRPNVAIILFCSAAAVAFFLLTALPAAAILCLLVGLFMGPPAGAIMALPAKVLQPESRAFGFGVFYTCFYASMAVGPAAAGFLQEVWNHPAPALIFGGLLLLAAAPLLGIYHGFSTDGAKQSPPGS